MTVRIDTARNQIAATVALLTQIGAELEDLHHLAYERPTTIEQLRVNGGQRDWALDTHGNPFARQAYRDIGEAIMTACAHIAERSHAAAAILRTADDNRPDVRSSRTITALHLAELIEARARRTTDPHQYSPIRYLPQPDADTALRQSEHALKLACIKIEALSRLLDRAKRDLNNCREGRT